MPELPEVETVRRGLAGHVVGQRLGSVRVLHPRAVRRQPGGAGEFAAVASGLTVSGVHRRGKYLWFRSDARADDRADRAWEADGEPVLVAHLGMSGQFRVLTAELDLTEDPHVRAWWPLSGGGVLAFRDQRTFGWLLADELVGDVPRSVAHVAPDPFEAAYDRAAVVRRIRRSRSGIKRILLAQTVVSGIGNIYADEALWRARVHPEHPGALLSAVRAGRVLDAATEVMTEALRAGGTSFDPLYVAVNGESGWFDRSLAVYGREGQACLRCGRPLVRELFTNRSSHRCPHCQRLPRTRWA